MFSCEFCKIFKNTLLIEHVWATASRSSFKVNESRYIVLFVVNRFCPVEKCRVTPDCLYHDSLTLKELWISASRINSE